MDGWISEKEQIVWALDFQKCPFSHQASRVRFKFMLGDAQVVYSNIAWEITSISKKDFIHLHNPLPEEAGMKTKLFGKCCCQFIKGFLPNMALFGLLMITDDKWWLMTINDDWWPFNFKQTQWLNTHTHTTFGNSWYATWYRLIAPSWETVPVGVRILWFQINRFGELAIKVFRSTCVLKTIDIVACNQGRLSFFVAMKVRNYHSLTTIKTL